MKAKLFFALLIVIVAGIQPVFAQEEESAATEEVTVIAADAAIEEQADDEEPAVAAETGAEERADDQEPALAAETGAEEQADDQEPALAAETGAEEQADEEPAVAAAKDEAELDNIRNNPYFLESQRLAKLAQETYDYGDYDASAKFAEEASRYAEQSDVYVAIATAKYRLDQAAASGASKQYPAGYGEAQTWYAKSINARDDEEWGSALEAANKSLELLADLGKAGGGLFPLPASYTVRQWNISKDCLWNIAGRPWVYGDPQKWRILYNANKSKLPNPNNPNWLEPGIVLDIPVIKGEIRQGEWESGRNYGN